MPGSIEEKVIKYEHLSVCGFDPYLPRSTLVTIYSGASSNPSFDATPELLP